MDMKNTGRLKIAGMLGLAVGLGACVSSGFDPIAVTRDQSVVSSCQNLGDVSVHANNTYDDSVKALMQKASTKGANTLLITSAEPTDPPSDDGAKGVAYRCSMPSTGSTTAGASR
jgi:hypothetical protein